jgi:uncharacterized membrane protein
VSTASGSPRRTAWSRPASARRAPLDVRRILAAGCAVLDLVLLALIAGGVVGHLRSLVGLCFCLFVPGWSIVGLVRVRDSVLELCLAMALGLASLVVLAQFVITVNAWHLVGIDIAVCVACLVSLIVQVVRPTSGAGPS